MICAVRVLNMWRSDRVLDIKFVRENVELVQKALENRHNPLKLDRFVELEKRRREILNEVEGLKGQRNTVSKQISEMKKNKENTDAIVVEMRAVGDRIAAMDEELKGVESGLRDIMLNIPNIRMRLCRLAVMTATIRRFAAGVSRKNSILNRSRTGIWVQTWIFSMQNALRRSLAHASLSIREWGLVLNVPL